MNSAARNTPAGRLTSSNLRGWRRPTLVGVTGVIAVALAAGWHVRPVDPPAWQSSLVVGLVTAAAVWIRSGRRNETVERFGPWGLLVVLAVAVQATGDLRSPYQPLYLLIVLYAAAFLPSRRFAALLLTVAGLTVAAVLRDGARTRGAKVLSSPWRSEAHRSSCTGWSGAWTTPRRRTD